MKFKFRTPDYDLDPKKGKYWTTKNVSFPLPNSNEPFNVGRKFAFNDMDEGIRDVTSFLKHFRENKVTFEFQHGISNYESLRKYLEDLQISKNVVALNKVFQSNFNYASTSSPIAGGGGQRRLERFE